MPECAAAFHLGQSSMFLARVSIFTWLTVTIHRNSSHLWEYGKCVLQFGGAFFALISFRLVINLSISLISVFTWHVKSLML